MQVILKEDVVNLGYKDDIVTVKDGYGRNFLIPTGKAVIASAKRDWLSGWLSSWLARVSVLMYYSFKKNPN